MRSHIMSPVKSLEEIAPYPAPTADQKRYVIYLPEIEFDNEKNRKVELRAAKNTEVDGVNHYSHSGHLLTKILKGGYHRYHVIDGVSDSPTHTLMGGSFKSSVQPVGIHLGDETFLKYNSRLPIVVYAPKDVILNYVIWRADDEVRDASEG